MTGSGLHATALIGLGTLIKTEKCLPPAPQDEETEAGTEVGREWRGRPLKMWCGGVGVVHKGGVLIVFN